MRREIGTWRRLNTVERKSRRLEGRKEGRMVAAKVEVLSFKAGWVVERLVWVRLHRHLISMMRIKGINVQKQGGPHKKSMPRHGRNTPDSTTEQVPIY